MLAVVRDRKRFTPIGRAAFITWDPVYHTDTDVWSSHTADIIEARKLGSRPLLEAIGTQSPTRAVTAVDLSSSGRYCRD